MDNFEIACAVLSGAAYEEGRSPINCINKDGFIDALSAIELDVPYDQSNIFGFEAHAYQYNGQVIIAYTGTDVSQPGDIYSDVMLGVGNNEFQIKIAAEFYYKVKEVYGDNVVFTGHSLGGGLAALMGVFFDKKAITFDPAPFRLAATQSNAEALAKTLRNAGYAENAALNSYFTQEIPLAIEFPELLAAISLMSYAFKNYKLLKNFAKMMYPTLISREWRVSAFAVSGEFLTNGYNGFLSDFLNRLRIKSTATPELIDINPPGVNGIDLHSQALLIMAASAPELVAIIKSMPSLGVALFDETLYARKPSSSEMDLLVKFIKNEYTVGSSRTGFINRFVNDMQMLAGSNQLQLNDAAKMALIAQAMDWYYAQSATVSQPFFLTTGGGLQYTTAQGERIAGAQNKALKYLNSWLTPLMNAENHFGVNTNYEQWNVSTDTNAICLARDFNKTQMFVGNSGTDQFIGGDLADLLLGATGDDVLDGGKGTDLLLGCDGSDQLEGGDGADTIEGGEGADTLEGGEGGDLLKGGAGVDVYEFTGDFGRDVIKDTDGQGSIKVDGQLIPFGSLKKVSDNFYRDKSTGWTVTKAGQDADGSATLVIQKEGAPHSAIALRDWHSGDLGVTLGEILETPAEGMPIYRRDQSVLLPNANSAFTGLDFRNSVRFANDLIFPDAPLHVIGINGLTNFISAQPNSWHYSDYLEGGDFGDCISASDGVDTLRGGGGGDYLGGTRMLFAWIESDNSSFIIDAPYLNSDGDYYYGDEGDDTITGGWGGDYISGGHDNDNLSGLVGADQIGGGAGADSIMGDGWYLGELNESTTDSEQVTRYYNSETAPLSQHGNDLLDGGDGDDSVYGQGGADEMFGGNGNDRMYGDWVRSKFNWQGDIAYGIKSEFNGKDYLDGGAGNDFMSGDGDDDELYGGADDDEMFGDVFRKDDECIAGNDYLDGEEGIDTLYGGGRDDVLFGGLGGDYIFGDDVDSDRLAAADHGNDYLDGEEGNDQLVGGGLDDSLFGGSDSDSLWGDDAQNRLNNATHGNDYLDGEEGDDYLYGGGQDDELWGGIGSDLLNGDDVAANLAETAHGNDYLNGEDGLDTLIGGGQDDVLWGGAGNDQLWGDDTGGVLSVTAQGHDELYGEDGEDQLIGGGRADVLMGGNGNDSIWGDDTQDLLATSAHGDDDLSGDAGADVLLGGGGNDKLFGGTENDTLWGDDEVARLSASAHGNDFLNGQDGADSLVGGGGNDMLYGGADDDLLWGDDPSGAIATDGNDTLYGEGGKDQLLGGRGDDWLNGGVGDDSLLGGDGDDTLVGGGGLDVLQGGAGNDTYLYDGVMLASDGNGAILDTEGTNHIQIEGVNTIKSIVVSDSEAILFFDNNAALILGNAFVGEKGGGNILEFGGNAINVADWLLTHHAASVQTQSNANNAYLSGGAGRDILSTGMKENNLLNAGGGNDLYRMSAQRANGIILKQGDGLDELGVLQSANSSGASGNSTQKNYIKFIDGTNRNNLKLRHYVDGVYSDVLMYSESDGVALLDTLTETGGPIDEIRFNDNSSMSWHDLLAQGVEVVITSVDRLQSGTIFNDTFTFVASNERVAGLFGNDTFIYGLQDGDDTISAEGRGENDADKLVIESNNPSDAVFIRSGDDLIVRFKSNPQALLTVEQAFAGNALASIYFNEALTYSWATLPLGQFSDLATDQSDALFGTGSADVIHGLAGDDTLGGKGGADLLYGDVGRDSLSGGDGQDTLYGGKGDDILSGGTGSNTYVFSPGDGKDVILAKQIESNDVNTLHLAGGTLATNARFFVDGSDLRVVLSETDEVRVKDFFNPSARAVDRFVFDAGNAVTASGVIEKLFGVASLPTNLQIRSASNPDDLSNTWVPLSGSGGGFYLVETQGSRNGAHYELHDQIIIGFTDRPTDIDSTANSLTGADGQMHISNGNYLIGGQCNDLLRGGAYAHGGGGNDTLSGALQMNGGAGDDVLNLGAGVDGVTTVLFDGPGSGKDTIVNATNYWGFRPMADIRFTSAINASDVSAYVAASGHAVLKLNDRDMLSIESLQNVNSIAFADAVWSGATLASHFQSSSAKTDAITINVVEGQAFSIDPFAGVAQQGYTGEPIVAYRIKDPNIWDTLSWLKIDPATGRLSGEYALLADGQTVEPDISRSIEMIDRLGLVVSRPLILNVQTQHVAPKLLAPLPDLVIEPGEAFSLNVRPYFQLEQVTQFSRSPTPSWLSMNSESSDILRVYGTAPTGINTNYNVTVTMRDSLNLAVSDVFNLKVAPVTVKLTGTSGADTLTGSYRAETLSGGTGDDSLNGGRGLDVLIGGGGNDTYRVERLDEDVRELGGVAEGVADTVLLDLTIGSDSGLYVLPDNVENLTVLNNAGGSSLGNIQDNKMLGNSLSNYLDGGAGNDTLEGGLGDDFYRVDSTLDQIVETTGGGHDYVYTTANSFTLSDYVEELEFGSEVEGSVTGVGSDQANKILANGYGISSLKGQGGNDTLMAGDNNDTLDGGTGQDVMQGGLGDDIYWVDDEQDQVVEAAGQGSDTVRSAVSFRLKDGIEKLELIGTSALQGYGTANPDWISGNDATNLLQGFGGNDQLYGMGGSDDISGGDGDDTLDGGAGADAMNGGAGDDVFYVDHLSDLITESADGGSDVVIASIDHQLATNVENLVLDEAAPAALNGWGNEVANILWGNSSDNQINGSSGNDMLLGKAGADTLNGGADNDTLIGDIGDDWLLGEGGIDSMVGGDGHDLYAVDSSADVIVETNPDYSGGNDTVYASANYVLPQNVEFLVLDGDGALDAWSNADGGDITGNDGNNHLYGNDWMDVLDGGAGADTLSGGLEDDIYVLSDGLDTIIEEADAGHDVIWTYTNAAIYMPTHVEDVVHKSAWPGSAMNVTGNDLANTMTGSSNTSDRIRGGAGNDTIRGYNGNDSMWGGAGDDLLRGDTGNDSYYFNRGDGHDRISDSQAISTANTDKLFFEGDISSNQLWFARSGNNLVVSVIGTQDHTTILNWFTASSSTNYQIEQIKAMGDGKTLLNTKVDQLVQAMAGMTPPPAGQITLTAEQQQALAPTLAAAWG